MPRSRIVPRTRHRHLSRMPPRGLQKSRIVTLGDHQHEGVLERTEDRLAGLDDAPVDEHLVIYDAVLRDLGDALTGASDHQD